MTLLEVDTRHEGPGNIQEHYVRSEGFLVVYSITSRDSFKQVRAHHQKILGWKASDDVPAIIVANKCDLEPERQVSIDDGRDLAEQLGCMFIEVSAKQGRNLQKAFFDLVRKIRRFDPDQDHKSGRPVVGGTTSLASAGCFSGCVAF
ncbi:P-loop containing nucleoside triphosphate hydrolase protein [Mycena galopus ATCC 62051]|nr:P-loop containing nucleoside triphosphate hydrolase protein [Mycena galopus ATCC 62051]